MNLGGLLYTNYWVENVSPTGDFYYNGPNARQGMAYGAPSGWNLHTF